MDVFILLIVLILFGIILSKLGNQRTIIEKRFSDIDKKLFDLHQGLSELINKEGGSTAAANETPSDSQEVNLPDSAVPTAIVPEMDPEPVPELEDEAAELESEATEEREVIEETDSEQIKIAAFAEGIHNQELKEEITISAPEFTGEKRVPQKSWLQTFREGNPDIERFIGENLINKIGILILVLGISYFVKYAIDKDWINEPARVGIGILCGAIVMTFAHRLRKKYKAFSSVLVAGALSIFYFTIGIAFHDYQLFSQTVAFAIMVVITVFSAFISIAYDRKELAILTLIGGFGVPFMVSDGGGNYQVLFTYVAILNLGMLLIAYFKKWNIVTLLAFLFTVILFGGWIINIPMSEDFPVRGSFLFATIFYFIFSIAPVLNNIRNKGKFTVPEYFLMLINTFFYFGVGYFILDNWAAEFKGLFALSLAFYNFIYGAVLYRRFGIDKDAIYFLLGLALTFVTITIPLQFNGNFITLFWAAEAVLLLWLSQKSKIAAFKVSAIIIQILMVISLLMDWQQAYAGDVADSVFPLFVNKIFITGLFSIASLVLSYFILAKEKTTTRFYGFEIVPAIYRNLLLCASLVLGYLTGFLEISYQVFIDFSNNYSAHAYQILYHFAFSAVFIFFILRRNKVQNTKIALVISLINVFLYTAFFGRLSYLEFKTSLQHNIAGQSAYFIHYLLLIFVIYFFYVLIKYRKSTGFPKILNSKVSLWLFVLSTIIILSGELMIQSLKLSGTLPSLSQLTQQFPITTTDENSVFERTYFVEELLRLFRIQVLKVGYPILWGLISFVFLIIGVRKQNQQLRIAALALLGIVILKLFIYDIRNVSETGKIVAFILLGVLILLISFMYQRIKELVTESPKDVDHDEN